MTELASHKSETMMDWRDSSIFPSIYEHVVCGRCTRKMRLPLPLLLLRRDLRRRKRARQAEVIHIRSCIYRMKPCRSALGSTPQSATDAANVLDPATARRFLFKVHFPCDGRRTNCRRLPLITQGQRACRYPPARTLTPGDFAVVARKAEALGEKDPRRLAHWLEAGGESDQDGILNVSERHQRLCKSQAGAG